MRSLALMLSLVVIAGCGGPMEDVTSQPGLVGLELADALWGPDGWGPDSGSADAAEVDAAEVDAGVEEICVVTEPLARAEPQISMAMMAGGDAGTPPPPRCICDECRKCGGITKLCQVPHGSGNLCNPGIPGGTPPDWRWIVLQGTWANCAAISANGGTSSGHDYYGGTHNCALKNCRPYP